MFHIVFSLQRCWKLNKEVFGKVLLEKKIHVIFEIEKENSNYVKEMFLLKTTLLSGKIFYFQKEVVISKNFKKIGKEVICEKGRASFKQRLLFQRISSL